MLPKENCDTCDCVSSIKEMNCLHASLRANEQEPSTTTGLSSLGTPAEAASTKRAKALVSKIDEGESLVATVLLANKLTTAHLDSCATHCFVDSAMSRQLSARGYPLIQSPVLFDVHQGNPLCVTSNVHLLPLSIVREDHSICSWEQCLFLVADAGAPVIICYSALRLGGIIKYDPPPDYEQLLDEQRNHETNTSSAIALNLMELLEHPYTAPTQHAIALRTATNPAIVSEDCRSNMVEITLETGSENFQNFHSLPAKRMSDDSIEPIQENTDSECSASSSAGPKHLYKICCGVLATKLGPNKSSGVERQKRKGDTDMLSEENPYGKNPPLPDAVVEAVKHLKMLSNPNTTPVYTDDQQQELLKTLGTLRPSWANCITLQQTLNSADKETEEFLNILMDKPVYQTSIFSLNSKTCCDLREFEIPQKPGRDLWTPAQPRRYKNPNMSLVVEAWLDALIDSERCRESKASHPAAITVVEREQRDVRVCIDYRNRNARSDVPVFPMPNIQDFLDENAGFKYYCSFDMKSMFNQFKIKEEDRHLAAFITTRGVYEPNVVMFGLQGGPQHAVRECGGAMATDPLTNGKTFTEWAVEQNAQGVQPPYEICPHSRVVKGSRLRPFIDDVTIPSNHVDGMKKLVELFFEFCRKHNLVLSKKKAQLMKSHLRMLGFVVSKQGKHLDPHRIISLLEAKKPQSKETLHALLSSYTFVRMFIPNFASIAAPLHDATKGIIWKGPLSGKAQGIRETDPDFVWTPEMTRAFEQLKNALLEAPILVAVDWNYPLFLSVDASIRGEGWVLWQLISLADGTKVAVAILYGSRKYSGSEKSWETTRQEASAIRSALEDVYEYVFGQHFYLFSDHLNLRFMHNSANRAVIRMRDFLSQFNMTVIHCPGIWNNADPISRLEPESLPRHLADSTPSVAEAKLRDSSMIFSIGTSTEEDWSVAGTDRIQPQADRLTIQPSNCDATSALKAQVLNTTAEAPSCICFLCNLEEEWEDTSPTQEQAALPISVLHTEIKHSEQQDETDPIDWANVLKFDSPREYEYFVKEAQRWNQLHVANPTVSYHIARCRELNEIAKKRAAAIWTGTGDEDTRRRALGDCRPKCALDPNLEKESDDDDLSWCGEFNRKATVLRTPVSSRFKQSQLNVAPNQNAPLEIRVHTHENVPLDGHSSEETIHIQPKKKSKTVTFQTDTNVLPEDCVRNTLESPNPESSKESNSTFHEPSEVRTSYHRLVTVTVTDNDTQTTPADFRMATIRIPMIDDFREIHNNDSGHHGVDFSYRKLLKHCGSKWANERGEASRVKALLKEFIDACPICQKVRGLKEKIKTKHSFIVSRPFLEVSIDFIIFKREDKYGNRYLIVAISNFLKLVEMKPIQHRDAETVARFLLELQSRYGPMARLRSDKDGAFTGLLIRRLNEVRGTETAPCIPYHPQANSVCERQNAIIMNHLNALILGCALGPESKVGWSDLIPNVFSLVNNTPKNPLGISPLSLVYGVYANYDQPLMDQTCANAPGSESNAVDYVESLMAWQNKLLEISESIQSQHFEKLHAKLNKEEKQRQFQVGDYVLQLRKSTGSSGKPGTIWAGPFLVMDRRNNDPSHPVLDLMNLTNMKVKEASIADCRIFNTSWFEEGNLHKELVKLAASDDNEYVVERIVSHQPSGETRTMPLSKYLFEVKWQDFAETTWEPYAGLKDLEPMEKYSKLHPRLNL